MADDDLIRRPEFDATMQGVTQSINGLGAKVESTKDDLIERLSRVEGKQDAAASANMDQALANAREAGKTDARLEALEARAAREWMLWAGMILAIVTAVLKWLFGGRPTG